MFNLPDRYRMNVKLPMKDCIPKNLKPDAKKRLKNTIKEIRLIYQIIGEEIPSVINDKHKCQVIQIYDIAVSNIKDVAFVAGIYQEQIKSLCILRIHDKVKESYSFAIKRLSKTEENQIIVLDSQYTDNYTVALPDKSKKRFIQYMSFENIINKTNKVNYYYELYIKLYMLNHEKAYENIKQLLDMSIWYDEDKVIKIYEILKKIVSNKEQLSKENSNIEKVKLNRVIKESIQLLEVGIN